MLRGGALSLKQGVEMARDAIGGGLASEKMKEFAELYAAGKGQLTMSEDILTGIIAKKHEEVSARRKVLTVSRVQETDRAAAPAPWFHRSYPKAGRTATGSHHC